MGKVYILYHSFFSNDGEKLNIGGIQTYIQQLINLVNKKGMMPIVVQGSKVEFTKEFQNTPVLGVPFKKGWSSKRKSRALINRIKDEYNREDIIIFASHDLAIKLEDKKTIGIHHGITSDIPKHTNQGRFINYGFGLIRSLKAYKTIFELNHFGHVVSVDHNVPNWYRSRLAYPEVPIRVIPNATDVIEFDKPSNDMIKIIFARRFFPYRGTRLFSKVILQILNNYSNIEVTFAGEGPDEEFLHEKFKKYNNVKFIKYDIDKTMDVLRKYQIAVVPTLGSEGTSLSLIEAMASKCAVIATNVGGMTNIVLDEFNGVLINPDEQSLYNALEKVISHEDFREKISTNAFSTVKESFNISLWEKKWSELIDDVLSN